jgi:Uncharacterized conserved protein
VIPSGRFTMGSSAAEQQWAVDHGATAKSVEDESPQHTVVVPSFAIGKYDVTRAEYAKFVSETGYPPGDGCGHDGFKWIKQPDRSWQNPEFTQSDRDPVVCVSWNDARAYIAWLNGKVGSDSPRSDKRPYRLPTEAEWEYAARGGTTTLFWWGDDINETSRNAWFKDNSDARTQPVGLKPPNRFGLYDVTGHVWQWTQDCYAPNYANAPSDGSAAERDSSCLRVDRGGSSMHPEWLLRSAPRERNPADYRYMSLGFRVARSLP